MSEALLARLEALADRLEKSGFRGGAGLVAGAGAAEEKEDHPSVAAYKEYYSSVVAPWIATCAKSPLSQKVGELTETAWKHQLLVLQAASESKKPEQKDLLTFLQPIVDVVNASSKLGDSRSPSVNWEKAFQEYIQAVNWIFQPTTKPFVIGQLEAASFWLDKILVGAKAKSDSDKAVDQAFVKGCKDTLNGLSDICFKFFKTGLEWNNRSGVALKDWKAGGSVPAPPAGGPVAPPCAPPAPSAPVLSSTAPAAPTEGGGMGAVFSQISKGSAVTAGLKKVDKSQMTHKNPELRNQGPLIPKEKEAKAAPAATAKPVVKREAKVYESKGTWFVENFDGENAEVDKAELANAVYILRPRNCTITVKGKVKSIQIDGGFKCTVIFESVLALVEVFNSQRVTVRCEKSVPAFAVDKTQGCQIQMTREAMVNPPEIVTSSVSEVNFYIPHPTDLEADPVELPIPEQFSTKYKDGKLHTESISHSGG